MSAQTRSRRRPWRWVALALVIVAAIVIVVLAYNGSKQQEAENPTATPAPSPTSTADGQPGAVPTGCLGGPSRDAEMLMDAQGSAPHTRNGAVEVSAAFVRWLNQFPYPNAEESERVQEASISAESPMQDLAGFFQKEPNLSGGLVADGFNYYLSTVGGVYFVETEAADLVTTSIGTALVEDGALSPMLKGSIMVTVVWEDDSWKFVSSEGTRTTEELFAIGSPFTGGC